MFNTAALPYNWADWGWRVPAVQEDYLHGLRRAKEAGFGIHTGHLMWPSRRWSPEYLQEHEDQPEKMRAEYLSAVREALEATKPFGVAEWTVVNEPYGQGDLLPIMGRGVMLETFRLAEQIQPEAHRLLNETLILSNAGETRLNQEALDDNLRFLLDNDAPVQGLGLQGHFGSRLTPPSRVYELLEHYAAFGLPISITEFDIDIGDEQAQADYLRDFYTVAFSHPAVHGIVSWGFWAEEIWKDQAAWYRKDWTPKPVAEAYRDLVLGEWWTDEVILTDADGRATVDGFHGTYRVSLPNGEPAVVELTNGGATATVVFE